MANEKKNYVIVGLSNGKKLAEATAKILGVKASHADTFRFADGEILVKLQQTVRGKDVYVFQSTSNPVNDNLMELLIAIDALKRASAKSINVIIPYYGYARQDRKSSGREPITAKLVASFLERAGANKVILLDIHAEQTQGFFDIPVDTLKATYILLDEFVKTHKMKDLCVVSPDYGGVKRARNISIKLNVPLAIIDKRRPAPNKVEISNVLGDVKGKDCLLVDDMIDTGGTVLAGAKILKEKGAKSINIMCTHAVFSNNAIEKFKTAIKNKELDNLYITDSIPEAYNYKSKNIHVCALDKFFADVIKAQDGAKSISDVYKKYVDNLNVIKK